MICLCKIRKITLALMVFIAMGICAVAGIGFAGENGDTSINNTTPQIKEIPAMKSEGPRDFVKDVEKQYDFIGIIDDVQSEGIVIGDTYFKKAPGAAMSGASKGAYVGLILNKDREIVLCEPVKKIRR